ncbi:MAG: nucleotide exchange factor GrpE [Candidatus Nanohaloarchaea archaeon]
MSYEDLSREQLVEALEEIEEKVSRLEQEKEDAEEKAKKVKADFDNYRKREEDRKERWQEDARKQLAEELIEVMDNLERAIASADEETGVVKGVKMVADQLYETLQDRGLERIHAEGEEFNPSLHRAVDTETHEEHNRVVREKRKGYMYNDEVLRESEVVVGKNDEEN